MLAVERNTVNSYHEGAAGSLADRIGIQVKNKSKENSNAENRKKIGKEKKREEKKWYIK